MYRVIFFGSNQYSLTILQKLLTLPDYNIVAVVTKPDSPAGRGKPITKNPVSQFVSQNSSLPLFQPEDFVPDFVNQFAELKADLGICVAYGPPFFTPTMCQIPRYGIINLHPSRLPQYRGAAPGPWQIIHGESQSALTFFLIDEKPDHGPLIAQIPFTITPNETSTTFYEKAFSLGARNLEITLNNYLKDPQAITPQDHSQKSYFPKLTKDSGKIDWSKDPQYLERFIRAMQPWPLAWTEVIDADNQIKRAQILSSHLENGKIILDQVKIEGKREAFWKSLQGHYQLL